MRKRIVAGNWKMNLTPSEAAAHINKLIPLVNGADAEVVFCVPSIDIPCAVDLIKNTDIHIGAQDMSCKDNGAYTGEISPAMLKDCKTEYVIIGHSERRKYFHETDETVNLKVKKALEYGLIPIICCGESLQQREQGITLEWINMQIKIALKDVPAEKIASTVIAYEPIWAIGTGNVATKEQAQEVCASIRKCISDIASSIASEKIRILYGGSVNGENAPELFAMDDIDGGLIGGASLKVDFAKIVTA